jgi:hypothetical protein
MAGEYHVVYLNSVRKSVSEILDRSWKAGLEKAVIDAARIIEEQLKSNPREFGDPLGSLHGMHLDLFMRGVPPLIVYYGVHQTKALVFVRKIGVVPFSGL